MLHWFVVTKHKSGEILYSGTDREKVIALTRGGEIPEQETREVYSLYGYHNSIELIRNAYSRARVSDMKALKIPRNVLEQLLKSFDGS
jgi:hypothetical protein